MVMCLPVQDFHFQCAGPSLTYENGRDSHRDGVSSKETCSHNRR